MRGVVALMIAATLLLSGCGLTDLSYTTMSPHVADAPPPADGEMRVENYNGLRTAIMRLVETSADSGVIRMYNFSGDAEADVGAACQEVMYSEPLGAYAVASMSHSVVRILAYYEVTINITYRRTAEQIAAIEHFSNSRDFERVLSELYMGYGEELTADLQFYNAEQYDIERMLETARHRHPLNLLAQPEVSMTLHPPDSGFARIMEVKLTYPMLADDMRSATDETLRRAASIVEEVTATDRAELVTQLAMTLAQHAEYLPDREDDLEGDVVRDMAFTAYGALVDGQAVSEGFALALRGLLDNFDVENLIITGRFDGIPHVWNLVLVDDAWYHMDAALCSQTDDRSFLLKTDAEVAGNLKWNTSSYPPADGPPITQDAETAAAGGLDG